MISKMEDRAVFSPKKSPNLAPSIGGLLDGHECFELVLSRCVIGAEPFFVPILQPRIRVFSDSIFNRILISSLDTDS